MTTLAAPPSPVRDVAAGIRQLHAASSPPCGAPTEEAAADAVLPPSISFVEHDAAASALSGGLCMWSPDEAYLAVASGKEIRIMDAPTLRVASIRSCRHPVNVMEWSPDSTMLLAASLSAATIQVFSVENERWKCSLTEGPAGLVHAFWSPDSRHVLGVADFQLMVSVWSLTQDAEPVVLDAPKFSRAAMAFSKDGRYLAVVSRRDCKDAVCVYATDTWEQVRRFVVDTTDAAALVWTPDDTGLILRDDPLEYKMYVYRMDGAFVTVYTAYEDALGVKRMQLSQRGTFLALGSYDEKVRLVSTLTWTPVMEFTTEPVLEADGVAVFTEVHDGGDVPLPAALRDLSSLANTSVMSTPASRSSKPAAARLGTRRPRRTPAAGAGAGAGTPASRLLSTSRMSAASTPTAASKVVDGDSHFELSASPATVPARPYPKPSPKASPPLIGAKLMKWATEDDYLAVLSDRAPRVVFVFSTTEFKPVAALVLLNPVKSFAWDPKRPRLAVVTGNSKVYTWEPSGATFITVEEGFRAGAVRWSPSGAAVLVMQRGQWRVGFLG